MFLKSLLMNWNDPKMMKKCLLVLCYASVFLPGILGFSKTITLGGLFEEDDPSQEAFVLSVNAVNFMRRTTDELANVFFAQDSRVVTKDVFDIELQTCSLLGNGVAAIFGPSDKLLAEHVQSICDSVDMPNVVARWDVNPMRMKAFNFYPHVEELAKLFLRLVTEFNWKTYTILYDNSDNLVLANKLLKRWDPKGYTVTIRYLGAGPNYRDILMEVKQSKDTNIVIDCSYDILEDVLIQSQQVGLFGDNYEVIVTNLDLHTLDLEPYQYSGSNFTGVRLVDVENPDAQRMFDDYLYEMENVNSLGQLRVEQALTYDSVQLFARAFKRFQDAVKGNIKPLACNGKDNWELGESLRNYMRTTEVKGLTGLVKLDPSGFRSDFKLDILQLNTKGLKTIGTYNGTYGIKWKVDESAVASTIDDSLFNKTFKVLIALNDPYNMLKESAAMKSGNDRYEGFAIEIIQELAKVLRFNYTFIETDLDYGSKGPDGKWTGMLGRIMNKEADLAITDLTITAERESVVDFTLPFMNLGIAILYRTPTRAPPSLFSFLSPFSSEIWLYLGGSYIFVSLCLFVIGRMCPAEWNNPYPCIEEPEQLENQFTLKNALWFTLGSIMQQGSEIAPIGLSTRMLASAWWFFCLIIVALYTANLAAFLVFDTPVKPIKSAEDLAALNGAIKYGAKRGGSTFNFFKVSNYEPYAKMYQYMVDNEKDVMTDSNEEGTKKVLDPNQNYAFLMESSSIEYIEQRQCKLSKIGNLLDAKGYGIAMQKNMTYRRSFNEAVLTLQETGVISRLQTKWWTQKRDGGKCKNAGIATGPATALTLENVGGVFLTLGVGVALAVFFAIWECVWGICSNSDKEDLPFKQEFVKEMKFVLKCKGTSKSTGRRKSSRQTTESSTRASTPPYDIMPTIITTSAGNR